MQKIGIVKGSGFENLMLEGAKEERVYTPYDEIDTYICEISGIDVVQVPRHGQRHETLPHDIEYRSIIHALKECQCILSLSAVGSLSQKISPGEMVLPYQYIDLCQDVWSFSPGLESHVDMSAPFCSETRKVLLRSGASMHDGGTYARMRGPTFETAAETQMLRTLGADIVGMTIVPEAKLARQIGICYQPIAIVTNFSGGLGDEDLSHQRTLAGVERIRKTIEKVVRDSLPSLASMKKHDHRE
jgi:5'-methylthioadenosine phosphorylase